MLGKREIRPDANRSDTKDDTKCSFPRQQVGEAAGPVRMRSVLVRSLFLLVLLILYLLFNSSNYFFFNPDDAPRVFSNYSSFDKAREFVAKEFRAHIHKNGIGFAQITPNPKYTRSIMIIASKRCLYIENVLQGIIDLPYSKYYKLFISYDGPEVDSCVSFIFERFQTHITELFLNDRKQFSDVPLLRLTKHYRFALEKIFVQKNFDYCIIFEDDIVPVADTFSYFLQLEELLRADPTIAMINSANHHSMNRNSFNPYHLYRMESLNTYVFSFGYLLPKDKYLEYQMQFPEDEHTSWDYNLYALIKMKDYNTIYPELTRVRHIGEKGTTSDARSNRRNKNIATSLLADGAILGSLDYLIMANYDLIMKRLLTVSKELPITSVSSALQSDHPVKLLFKRTEQSHVFDYSFEKLGVLPIFEPNYYGTLITHNRNYASIILIDEVATKFDHVTGTRNKSGFFGFTQQVKSRDGESCNSACSREKKRCDKSKMRTVNDCILLSRHFPCTKCSVHFNEPPGYQLPKPGESHVGFCIVSLDWYHNILCSDAIPSLMRLCPCH